MLREVKGVIVCTPEELLEIVKNSELGTINNTIVSVPEVFKAAILSNARNILVLHNHPSGDYTPSQEDINTTKNIAMASKFMGIKLLDHIIVAGDDYLSMKRFVLSTFEPKITIKKADDAVS